MTTLQRTATTREFASPRRQLGTLSWKWITTTDQKLIGILFFNTSMDVFMLVDVIYQVIKY